MAIARLLDREDFLTHYHSPTGRMPNRGLWWFTFGNGFECFATAPKPDPSSTVFVAGGSDGTVVITERQADWNTSQMYKASDVTSIDWLDQNVYMTGERSGAVRLWDTRNRGRSLRFQFPICINHVKKLGEQKVVVAGLRNNVSFLNSHPPPPLSGHKF